MMAAFKGHAALNFWRGQELRRAQAGAGAMGQFGKLTSLADLPPDSELERLITEAARLSATAPAHRKPKHARPTARPLHPDFASALEDNADAKRVYESFPPSAQRDYADWVAEAKLDATRARRIATAVEWLSEGKRHNWRYERC